MAQLVKCMICKYEDLSSIPRSHVKKSRCGAGFEDGNTGGSLGIAGWSA